MPHALQTHLRYRQEIISKVYLEPEAMSRDTDVPEDSISISQFKIKIVSG